MRSDGPSDHARGDEREASVPRDLYFSDHYFSYEQLWSMAEQVRRIHAFKPRRVLEIGVGNGFVSTYLRAAGLSVTTFDINPNLKPDIVAPIRELEAHVTPGEYDLIACCEVLEHQPFSVFGDAIERFARLSDNLFLTVPDSGRKFGWGGLIQLPRFRRWVGAWWKIPFRAYELTPEHFWEVGFTSATGLRVVMDTLTRHYERVETGLFKANPYHRFFVCRGIR